MEAFKEFVDQFDEFRRIRNYGGKDYLVDVIPRQQIFQDTATALEKSKYVSGELIWSLFAIFYYKDLAGFYCKESSGFQSKEPFRKVNLLRSSHPISYVNRVNEQAHVRNLDLGALHTDSINPSTVRMVEAGGNLDITGSMSKIPRDLDKSKKLELLTQNITDQALLYDRILLNESLDYCHLLEFSIKYLNQEVRELVVDRAYVSEEIVNLLPDGQKMLFLLKEPYTEAYSFPTYTEKVARRFVEDLATLIALQCKDYSVGVRCLKPVRSDRDVVETISRMKFSKERDDLQKKSQGSLNQMLSDIILMGRRFQLYVTVQTC